MKKIFLMLMSVICITAFPLELSAEVPLEPSSAAENGFNENDIPLKKITLYSSGVAHYEHEGTVKGAGKINFLFLPAQISDVLKSIFVKDPAAKNLTINYQSKNTLQKTMQSLKVDLSLADSLFTLLKAQKGAEIEVYTPNKISGKILGLDKIKDSKSDILLSVASSDGVNIISFKDIQSLKFTDSQRNEDLHKALDLILEASVKMRKRISIDIDSTSERKIGISYVMEAPIWKPSYRIDMGNNTAAFQAWAIIDNSTDLDWKNVKLTLTSGRPVGFKQNLYEPYYTYRKTIPILAGQAADPETFDSAYTEDSYDEEIVTKGYMRADKEIAYESVKSSAASEYKKLAENGSAYFEGKAAIDSAVGEMFAFSPSQPINLARQKSTMIPLALAAMPAKKYSVFSGIPSMSSVHPKLCISIENNSGLKFPAGAITIFENGEYVGDAILEFLPENEKRLIGFGDDMDVYGAKTEEFKNEIQSVKIVKGALMRRTRFQNETVYTIKNSSSKDRSIIVEHPISSRFKLSDEKQKLLLEKTADKYRFNMKVKGGSQEKLSVIEERFDEEMYQITSMDNNSLIAIYSDTKMPQKIKNAFDEIISQKTKLDTAQTSLVNFQNEQKVFNAEQERVRKNIQAIGSETQQGKQFLDKLLQIEDILDSLKQKIQDAEKKYNKAKADFFDYIQKINIEA